MECDQGEVEVARLASLRHAVAELVHDGHAVALDDGPHLAPFAAVHEIIRRRRRDLTLISMCCGPLCTQLIAAGCVKRLVLAQAVEPTTTDLSPTPLELEQHSGASMVNAFAAGAAGLPFAILHDDVDQETALIACPFTGEKLRAVPPLRPDLAIVHAQKADRRGNVLLWGALGLQKEAVFAAARTLVTVEELVDELDLWPNACVLPAQAVTMLCHVPGGAYPSAAEGYYDRDAAVARYWPRSAADLRQDEPTKMMVLAAARLLPDDTVCFVGAGSPAAAATLARSTHAPGLTVIHATGADRMASTAELSRYWWQGRRIAVALLEPGRIDRFGGLGPGLEEIVQLAGATVVMLRHDRQHFVAAAEHVGRKRPLAVVTDLGVLTPDPATGELTLTSLHPGVSVAQVKAATGWELKVADALALTTAPTPCETAAWRRLLPDPLAFAKAG